MNNLLFFSAKCKSMNTTHTTTNFKISEIIFIYYRIDQHFVDHQSWYQNLKLQQTRQINKNSQISQNSRFLEFDIR